MQEDTAVYNFYLRFIFWLLAGLYYQRVVFSDIKLFSIKYLLTFFAGPALATGIFIFTSNFAGQLISKFVADLISSAACYFIISKNHF